MAEAKPRQSNITASDLSAALQENNRILIENLKDTGHICTNQAVIQELVKIQALQANKIVDLETEAGKVHHALFDNGDQGLITKFALLAQKVGDSTGGSTWLKRTFFQVVINLSTAYVFWLALTHGPAK